MGAAMSERVRRHVSRLWWLEMRGLVGGLFVSPYDARQEQYARNLKFA